MSRRARRKREAFRAAHSAQGLSLDVRQEVFDDAYSQGFDKGFAKAQERSAEEKRQAVIEAERRTMEHARQKPFMVLAHQNGYNEGYKIGYETGFQQGKTMAPKNNFTYQDLSNARQRGYDDGFRAGQMGAPAAPSRDGIISEVLQQCEVIAQSNPNMAPGVNAVRHMVKKLK